MASSKVTRSTVLDRAAMLAEKRRLRRKYRGLFDDVTRILSQHDPMHIAYVPDEYDPETAMILARMDECDSPSRLVLVIRDVFREMFDEKMAGAPGRYEAIARDIWRAARERAATAG